MTPEETLQLKNACREIARDAELIAQLFHARLFELDRSMAGRSGLPEQSAVEEPAMRREGVAWPDEVRACTDPPRNEAARIRGQITAREAALLEALEHALGARLSPVALAAWLRICWTMSRAKPGVRQERAA